MDSKKTKEEVDAEVGDKIEEMIATRMRELLELSLNKQMVEDADTNGWYFALGFGDGYLAGIDDRDRISNKIREIIDEG
jgi:hypothetical protein